MIITEIVTVEEEQKKHSYSDANVYIWWDSPTHLLKEAFDPIDSDYTYTETDIPTSENVYCVDYASAYRIMAGDLIMDDIIERARALRKMIVKASENLSDEDALEAVELFPAWKAETAYAVGERIRYGEKLYRCEQAHTSQAAWIPPETPALWTEVAKPGEIPVWRQPTGAQDAYAKGDKVWYPDKGTTVYVSTVDDNVWEPGVYGWEVAT